MFRLGVIGLDSWFQANPIADRARSSEAYEIVAVADFDSARRGDYAFRYGVPSVFDTGEELLREADVDAVLITNKTSEHAKAAIQAAEAGKHVLVNRPIATTLEDADRMIAAADRAGTLLCMLMHFRFTPPYIKARELLRANAIGELGFATMSSRAAIDETTPRWLLQRQYAAGGGWLDHAAHTIDLLLWLTERQPVNVWARLAKVVHHDIEVDDYGIMSAELDGGVVINIESTWTSSPRVGYRENLILGGSEGEILASQSDHPRVRLYSGHDEAACPTLFETDDSNWIDAVCLVVEGFVEAAKRGDPAPIPGEDGRAVLRLILRAHEAASQGRVLPVQ